ncbi:MAG: putative glycoside hydrolase [Patescibacteria group bacterium]|jgi:chitodextrinase
MNRRLFVLTLILSGLILTYFNIASAAPLADRLRGFILLQVQGHGEAWYVIPSESKRTYLASGETAYVVMSKLGLGIKNVDLKKIPVGIDSRIVDIDSDGDGLGDKLEEGLKTNPNNIDSDSDGYSDFDEVIHDYSPLGKEKNIYDQALINRLRGKILLQVEEKGQAWYINPVNGRRYYMKDGPSAYEIMRFLSLGITNSDLANIPISSTNFTQNNPPTSPIIPPTQNPTSTPLSTADTQAPTVPTSLTATATTTQITLNWSASSDNRGVAGYYILRSTTSGANYVQINFSTSRQYVDSGLSANTTYYYVVRAYDAAANVSSNSNQAQARTGNQTTLPPISPPSSDTQAPTAPSNLTATSTSAQVTLAWTASSDNAAVTGYHILRASISGGPYTQINTTNSLSYIDSNLSADTYYYVVRAYDAAANVSSNSNQAQIVIIPPIQYVNISQPYSDKIVVANIEAPENTPYTWYKNSSQAGTGNSFTTFLAHFDGNLLTSNGESPLAQSNISYFNGKFGQGMRGKVEYPVPNNLGFNEGTVEIWLTLQQPITSSVYAVTEPGDPYIFKYKNSSTGEIFMVNIKNVEGIMLFTVYDGNWNSAVQASTMYNDVPTGESILLSMTYSQISNKASLYLNGFKISQHDFNSFNFAVANGNLIIGNNNAVVDEFRILNKALTADEVMNNYVRGVPFGSNEVYYSSTKNVNDNLQLNINLQGTNYTANSVVRSSKISVSSPTGYVLSNRSSINLSFNTATAATCRYGQSADNFSDLSYTASGTGTSHSINYAVNSVVPSHNFYIKCQNGADGDDYAWYRRLRILPNINNNWPKIGLITWGNNISSSEVNVIAKYDLVSLSNGNISRSSLLKKVKENNPNIILLPYLISDSNTLSNGVGGFINYDLYERLADSWRLRNAGGQYINNLSYPNEMMYNLNTSLPWAETLSSYVAGNIMSRGDWDGIWYDNVDTSFWWLYDYNTTHRFIQFPDFDLDGVNEDLNISADFNKAKNIWRDGLNQTMTLSRQTMGSDAIIVGNNGDANAQLYNGKVWERFIYYHSNTFSDNLEAFLDANNSNSFIYWNNNSATPHLNWNLFELNNTNDYKNNRLGMIASLLAGVYYNPVNMDNYREFRWYDEYWVDWETGEATSDASKGRGYLGSPVANAEEILPNVWQRDFQHGIVVLNNNATSTVTVDFGQEFRYIHGQQDTMANPGGTTQSITLLAHDARILLTTKANDPLR